MHQPAAIFASTVLLAIQPGQAKEGLIELDQANAAWIQCIARHRAEYEGSIVKLGPKASVNASQQHCPIEIAQVRGAIERTSGSATAKSRFKENKAVVVEKYRQLLSQERAGQVVLPKSCRPSVSAGLKAYSSGDYDGALCHWLPKARLGDAAAQNNMGLLFLGGLTASTPKSDEEAAKWFLLAARQGFVLAMRNLAQLQIRLGYNEAANSWLATAAAVERQQAEGAAILGYAIGCMMAGGCSSAARYAPTNESRPVSKGPNLRQQVSLCPNGTFIGGQACTLAPNGTYVYGRPTLAPDGTYVGGTPRLAPNGTYVGGSGRILLCPDGSYVAGERCVLTPAGTYVGG